MKAEDFRHRRLRLKMSQEKLADELGITQAAVSHYETGKRPIPESIVKLLRFVEAMHPDHEPFRRP